MMSVSVTVAKVSDAVVHHRRHDPRPSACRLRLLRSTQHSRRCCRGLSRSRPIALPLAEALGCVAADMPPLHAHPPRDIAAGDGWALRARDLVGASSYSPLPLATSPVWVDAGDAMPEGCDCVIDADSVDQTGPMVQALAEAIPGQGVRRAGGDIAEGNVVIASGRRVRPLDLLIARAAGLDKLERAPPAAAHRQYSRNLGRCGDGAADCGKRPRGRRRCRWRRGRGARCGIHRQSARTRRVRSAHHDRRQRRRPHAMLLSRRWPRRGEVIAHGIALQPGRTAAVGRIGTVPVIALPGAPDQALGGVVDAGPSRAGPDVRALAATGR